MGKKGNSRHVKSLSAPKYFGIRRKGYVYSAKPSPGRHTMDKSVSANLLIKILGFANTTAEANRVIRDGKMSVNGKAIRDVHYPIGFNDIVKLKDESAYIIGIDRRAKVRPVEYAEGIPRVLKVIGKYKTKNGKIMVRLHDNSILEAITPIKINDSVTIEGKQITNTIEIGKGRKCFVIDGVHVGTEGTIVSIIPGTKRSDMLVGVEGADKQTFETIAKNIIVTG